MKKIGVLTGGGDCPGLNAVIRAVVRKSIKYNWEIIGIKNGWKGLINGEIELLTDYSVSGILPKGGTIIGTSRTNPFNNKEDVQRLTDNIKKFGIDAIVAIGGDDTLSVANKLHEMGIPVVGVPKTIDNDLSNTAYTFGFWSAVQLASNTMDNITTTARSHLRTFVVEVMGRDAGWLTLMSGISTGADIILLPETPFSLKKHVVDVLKRRVKCGYKYHIIACSEGAYPTNESLKNDLMMFVNFFTEKKIVKMIAHAKNRKMWQSILNQFKNYGLDILKIGASIATAIN